MKSLWISCYLKLHVYPIQGTFCDTNLSWLHGYPVSSTSLKWQLLIFLRHLFDSFNSFHTPLFLCFTTLAMQNLRFFKTNYHFPAGHAKAENIKSSQNHPFWCKTQIYLNNFHLVAEMLYFYNLCMMLIHEFHPLESQSCARAWPWKQLWVIPNDSSSNFGEKNTNYY